jgi:integrase
MTRPRTLQIDQTNVLKKAKQFLNSKGRESKKTKDIYGTALYHFQTFLSKSDYKEYNIETILIPIENKEIDVYSLLDNFVGYLRERQDTYNGNTKLSDGTIRLYVAGVRSYLEYHDIEISSKRFRNKVTLPKKHRRRKQALTAEFIRTILLACNNTRLKVLILVLASGGARANEALSLRNSDIDFSQSPTKIHIMAEHTKTKQDRDIYISNEASKELKKFIESKDSMNPNDLVFSIKTGSADPAIIYRTLHNYFANLLKKVQLDKRRRGEGIQRREISFHSFRDYVKSTVAMHTNSDFSEWLIGHSGSTYWNVSEEKTRDLYLKCTKYLTFLDYPTVETVGRDFEAKIDQKDREIKNLNESMANVQARLDWFEQESRLRDEFDKKVKSLIGKDITKQDRQELQQMQQRFDDLAKKYDKINSFVKTMKEIPFDELKGVD